MTDNGDAPAPDPMILKALNALIPSSANASAVEAEFPDGTVERLVLLEFVGDDEAHRVLLSKAGAILVTERLTDTIATWDEM